MKISDMLANSNTKPMQIVGHKDFSRAAWLLRSETYTIKDRDERVRAYRHDTPLDSILRGTAQRTAAKLATMGL